LTSHYISNILGDYESRLFDHLFYELVIKIVLATPKRKQEAIGVLRQKFLIKNNAILSALVILAILFLLTLSSLPVKYETNDDFSIVSVLNRFFPGTDYLFLNPLTINILYNSYRIFPEVPWYGVLVYFAVYFGSSLILSVLLRSGNSGSILLSAPCLILIFLYCFSYVSITSASLLVLFGVYLCLLDWGLTNRCPIKHEYIYGFFLTAIFFLSFFLRWRLVLFFSVFAVPIFLHFNRSLLKKLYPFFLGFAFLIILSCYFIFSESSGNNLPYLKFNKLRGVFHDTNKGVYHGDITLRAIKKAGWSIEDYVLFKKHWFLYDQKRFNIHTINTFLEENNYINNLSIFKQIQERFIFHLFESRFYTSILFLSIIALFLKESQALTNNSITNLIKMSASLVFIITGILFFMYYRFVPRVYLPLYVYLLGTTFLTLNNNTRIHDNINRNARKRMLINFFLILIMLTTFSLTWVQGKSLVNFLLISENYKQKYIQNNLKRLKEKLVNTEDLLLVKLNPVTGLMQETIHPLKEFSDFTSIKIFPAGWQINSPRYFRVLENLGLKNGREFLNWTVNNKNVLWFRLTPARDKSLIMLIERYFQKHIVSDKNIKLKIVYDFRNQEGFGLVFYNVISEAKEFD
jgi:hypothetical protein